MSSQPPISTLRLALRAANEFTLDLLQIYRAGRDFADAMILAALVQSNAAPVASRADLQRRYAAFSTPIPPDMRRAISINAISSSLGLPFETVRRRARKLVDDGLVESTPQGLRFAGEVLRSDLHRQALEANYALMRELYLRLARNNCTPLMELPATVEPSMLGPEPPLRIVWRASAVYFLRMTELFLPHYEHLIQPFALMAVMRVNTLGLSDAVRGEDGLGVEAHVPDEFRRPARVSQVAAVLGLPHETTRRNLVELAATGRVERVREGFMITAAILAGGRIAPAMSANFRNLSRMFGELAETGVLARWDAERKAAESAA